MQEIRCSECGKLLFKGDALGYFNGNGTYTALDGTIKKQEPEHKLIEIKCRQKNSQNKYCNTLNCIVI
jgi:hypothetical protein